MFPLSSILHGTRRHGTGVAIVVLLLFASIAVGTVHTWSRTVVFLSVAMLVSVVVASRMRNRKPVRPTLPFFIVLCAAVATAVQLIPLPVAVLGFVSPEAHQVLRASLGDYGYHPLTLDPSATLSELAKLLCYAVFLAVATIYCSRAERRRFIVISVVSIAVVVALIGFLQAALGSKDILLVYTPQAQWSTLVRGTFVNPNHFGALMCLAAPCALVLCLRNPQRRWLYFASLVLLNVAAVLSLARATLAAVIVGQATVFLLNWVADRKRGEAGGASATFRVGAGIVVVASIATAVALGASHLKPALTQTTNELTSGTPKVHTWVRSLELVRRYPWTGVGRGSSEQAFTTVTDRGGFTTHPWLENGYLQSLVDWGVPVTLMLFALTGWAAVLALRRLRVDELASGTIAGLLALAVHECVDFAVELPGVALPALALVATIFPHRRSSADAVSPRVAASSRWLLLTAPVLGAAAIAAAFFPSANADIATLRAAVRDSKTTTGEVVALGKKLRKRHPAHYMIHALVAERLARERSDDALPWLNDAMRLNPTHPDPHLIAAELLASSGRKSQALLEYKYASSYAVNPRPIWDMVARRYPDFVDLHKAAAEDARSLRMFAKWLLANGKRHDAEFVYKRLLELDTGNVRALQHLTGLAVRRNDGVRAANYAQNMLQVDRSELSQRLAAQAYLVAGDLRAAAKFLDAAMDRNPDVFRVEMLLASALAKAGDFSRSRHRLERVERTWRLDRKLRIVLHKTRAKVELMAGNVHQSEWETKAARRLQDR